MREQENATSRCALEALPERTGRRTASRIRRGSWNEELFRVLEGFPDLAHDDEVDACSGALDWKCSIRKSRAGASWKLLARN
jgi:hypothetical protein